MYFVGFNVPNNCSMEDPVEDLILKMKLNNDRDLWDEQCWGFYDEIDLNPTTLTLKNLLNYRCHYNMDLSSLMIISNILQKMNL